MDCLLLQTERLYLRQLKKKDFNAYFELESNPDVMAFITGHPRSQKEVAERLKIQSKQYRLDPGFGLWAVCLKDGTDLIGTANLNFIPKTSIRQIGYKISPAWQGQGLATELALGLLAYGFECCCLSTISAICLPENKASEKVMQKVGMEMLEKAFFMDKECLHYRIESGKWFLKKQQNISFTANKLQA